MQAGIKLNKTHFIFSSKAVSENEEFQSVFFAEIKTKLSDFTLLL